jgi:hypothetical protein
MPASDRGFGADKHVEATTPMANIEYFDNKMKTERVAVQARAATGAEIQPASLIRAGHEIPVHLGATTFELLTANYCEAVLPHANREKKN